MNNEQNSTERRIALYESIADRLEQEILSSRSFNGTLPSEQYLADKFSASRPVIREALKLLKERGLITSHQGAQSVITIPGAEYLTRSVDRIIKGQRISRGQLYEIRIALETLAASFAAQNAVDGDLERLKELNRRFSDKNLSAKQLSELDMKLHIGIAEASGNALLAIMVEALSPLLLPVFERNIGAFKNNPLADKLHSKIISAIENGDADAAAELMRIHLTFSKEESE